MKKSIPLLAAALALFLSSCFEHNAVITLNKDGSGTITEETILGAQASAMMEQMAGLGGDGGPDPFASMADEAKAKENAAKLGEGVTVSNVEKIDKDGRKGGRVVYAFKDINALKYSFGKAMGEMGEGMKPPGAEAEAAKADAPLTFSYKDGVLALKNPNVNQKPDADKSAASDEEMDDQSLAMAQQMMADMRVSLKIELPGGIAETNASHVEGNTVTFMDLEMGKLVKDPEKFKAFAKLQPETPAEMQEALKGVDGVKIETQEEVTIKLK